MLNEKVGADAKIQADEQYAFPPLHAAGWPQSDRVCWGRLPVRAFPRRMERHRDRAREDARFLPWRFVFLQPFAEASPDQYLSLLLRETIEQGKTLASARQA